MAENQRIAKQFIYTVFYLVLFVGFLALIYFIFLKPAPSCFDNKLNQGETGVDCGGPCLPCELRTLKPIELVFSRLLTLNGPVAFFQLRNVNPAYGVEKLPYTLELRAKDGSVIQMSNEETFIYPGELERYVIKPLDVANVANITIKLGNYDWKSISAFSRPKIDFREIRKNIEENKIFVRGVVINNDSLLFPKVTVGALFYDKAGFLAGVSNTDVRDVRVGETRFFQIEHPVIQNADLEKTRLFFEAKKQ